ncbi:MAG: glycosyltransferase [Pseudomonadota bacterium]
MRPMPTILFIHKNFPTQFRYLAPYLARQGWGVYALSQEGSVERHHLTPLENGVRIMGFAKTSSQAEVQQGYLTPMNEAVDAAVRVAAAARKLRALGVMPDLIVAHSGWGNGSFAKSVWPAAKFVAYVEWWYRPGFDDAPEDPPAVAARKIQERARLNCRNLPSLLDVAQADAIWTPTIYQLEGLPPLLEGRVAQRYDGVDCAHYRPNPRRGPVNLPRARLAPDTPILTYATRGMEPVRGFPEFMAALSRVQALRPEVHCIIAGLNEVFYDNWLPNGESYLQRALSEHSFDESRLHLVGKLDAERYRALLARSDAHVYLTRPFVISWSLTEAMACAAPLIVSDTPPVREFLPDDAQAKYIDHTDIGALTSAIIETLDDPSAARARGNRARERALEFDTAVLLPAHETWLLNVLSGRPTFGG